MSLYSQTKDTESYKRRKREHYHVKKHRKANPDCFGCGSTYAKTGDYNEIHHLIPLHLGGTHKDGLVTLCKKCHRAIHTVNGQFYYQHVNAEITEQYRLKIFSA